MTPLPATKVLDSYYLEARCKLLEIAAILDRIDRGSGGRALEDDPRLGKVRQAIEELLETSAGRAERIQRVFSLDYEPGWQRPQPGRG
jgi:hypothetical protein